MSSRELIASAILVVVAVGVFFYIFSYVGLPEISISEAGFIDDEGFASWSCMLNTSGFVEVDFSDSTGSSLFSDEFYEGEHEVNIPLSSYRGSVDADDYKLRIVDHRGRVVEERVVRIFEPSFVVSDVDFSYVDLGGSYVLTGILVKGSNTGSVPLYPTVFDVEIDGVIVSGFCVPEVVLGGESEEVFFDLSIIGLEKKTLPCVVSILDRSANSLAVYESIQTPSSSVALDFSWRYQSRNRMVSTSNLDYLYEFYSSVERFELQDYSAYVFSPFDEGMIGLIAYQLDRMFGSGDQKELVNGVASFVREAISYGEDVCPNGSSDEFEYPRFPVETLVDGVGDCEDTAVLLAALLRELDVNVSLLRLPNHMAVGVFLNESLSGYEPFVDDYYFLESTSNGGSVGWVPLEYRGETNVTAYELDGRPVVVQEWKKATRYSPSDGVDYVSLELYVENVGSSILRDAVVIVGFEGVGDSLVGSESFSLQEIGLLDKILIKINLDIPLSVSGRLISRVIVDGEILSEKRSADVFMP